MQSEDLTWQWLSNEFERYYDRAWLPRADYFQVHRKRFLESFRFLFVYLDRIDYFQRPVGGRVYDVGGDGPISRFIVEQFGWELCWIDSDLRQPLSIRGDSVDVIVCAEVIEHIKDRDSVRITDLEAHNYSGVRSLLGELVRIMKPTGVLLLSTPNADSYINLYKWLHREVLVMEPGHTRELSIDELLHLTREAGLECVGLETVNSWDDNFGEAFREAQELIATLPQPLRDHREDNILAVFRQVG